jgi:hypothetical protein
MGIRCADHATPLYSQTLAVSSLTDGGLSIGIVRSRTKATGLLLLLLLLLLLYAPSSEPFGFYVYVNEYAIFMHG